MVTNKIASNHTIKMVQLLTPSDSNSIAADTVRTMYVQMLDIYRKYQKYQKNQKYRKYRKNLIFSIFSKISRYFPILFLYRMKDRSSFFLTRRMFDRVDSYQKFWGKMTMLERKRRFSIGLSRKT